MRTPTFYADFVPMAMFQSAMDRLQIEINKTFVEKANILGLDPASDFRHADLCGCDFSNCDLRFFDFTGADLRGAYGLSISWDGTTSFSGALLQGSPFAAEAKMLEDQVKFPEWEQAFLQVSRQDEASAFQHVVSLFREPKEDNEEKALFVAKKMFFNAASSVVRNNMLYCLSAHVRDASDTREFLAYLVAKHTGEPSVMRSAVRVMAEVCFRDPAATEIFFACLKFDDERLRLASIRGLIKAPSFETYASRLCRQMSGEPLLSLRKLFLETFSRRQKIFEAVSDGQEVIDYQQRIEPELFERLTINFATTQIKHRLTSRGDESAFFFSATLEEARPFRPGVRQILSSLKKLGLPIALWDDDVNPKSKASR